MKKQAVATSVQRDVSGGLDAECFCFNSCIGKAFNVDVNQAGREV